MNSIITNMTAAPLYAKFFKRRHSKLLLILVAIELLATLVWFCCFDIPELNPVLAGPINESLLNFVMTKILIIGGGAMGSAFTIPCLENKNNVTITIY